ncbi:fungal specific transcription factor [Diaporthe eres]|nr:fungal specific transcription factor [Diaporthe eres]
MTGNSSGVYFVNTVRRAFADADVRLSAVFQDKDNPSPEDCIVADEDDGRSTTRRPGEHRFFPFLHGPTLAKDIESVYSSSDEEPSYWAATQGAPDGLALPLARVIILQCLFNLASLHGDVELPAASRIGKPSSVLSCLLGLAAKGDFISIQALFAAQLLLVARMSLRTAVVVAGLLSRAIFLAGLHRCPVRYRELSADDCDIRKRLFWSIYVLDRFLSQALGHPLGIQDSDVDVCSLAGPELHHRHFLPHGPLDHPGPDGTAVNDRPNQDASSAPEGDQETGGPAPSGSSQQRDRHLVLFCQVEYSRLLGRALELFHKSIHVRSIDPSTVLSLRTDMNAWWNSLPSELHDFGFVTETERPPDNASQLFSAPAFFNLLHNQLRLLIHRPWLSLEPSTAESQSALQICIGSSREIILNMRKQRSAGCALFWPGHLEIALCLDVLSSMSSRWPLAKNCHIVLSDLQQTVRLNRDTLLHGPLHGMPTPGHRISSQAIGRHVSRTVGEQTLDHTRTPKRRRIGPDAQAGQSSGLYSGDLQSQPNGPLGTRRQADQTYSPGPSEAAALGSVINDPASRLASVHPPERQPAGAPALNHPPSQQLHQQELLPPHDPPITGTPDIRGLDAMGFSTPGFGSGDDSLMGRPSVGNWDGGMPDILGGVTWGSLLNVVNQDNLAWRGGFL